MLRERAAAELELRRRARLLPFDAWLREVSPSWDWDPPHLVSMRVQLERLRRREITRLWIYCPPRHGKTEQNTVRFAAHWIECNPADRVLIWANTQGLANRFSRKVRRICSGRVPLSEERNAAEEWETAVGGGLRAAGVGVGIAGVGYQLIIIDDPVKNREQAESQTYRDKIHEGYTDDLVTRLEPGGVMAGTMTRWHEDDLAGRVMASEEAADWTVLNLPAIAEEGDPLGRTPGEALWPDRYPIDVLEQRKRVLGRTFHALFQGSPRPAEGNAFKQHWFRYWQSEGEGDDRIYRLLDPLGGVARVCRARDCRRFGTMDLATSLKTSADYTVLAVWAVTPESDLLLVDLVRDRLESPDVIALAAVACRRHDLAYLAVEANGMQLGLVQTMRRQGMTVRGVVKHVDKLSYAQTAIVRCEAGQVYWPERAPWLHEFERELLGFPTGTHDDQVDVASMAAADVFRSGAPEPADRRQAREEAEAKAEVEARVLRAIGRRNDRDDPHWWGDDE